MPSLPHQAPLMKTSERAPSRSSEGPTSSIPEHDDHVTVIEVFADVLCPFTHVGLRRFVHRRSELRREDVVLHVRAWPLELVNGSPLLPELVSEEIEEIRGVAPPRLFAGFAADKFPSSSLPALRLAVAAYRQGFWLGEQVSLHLRDLLFEQGVDIADETILEAVARAYDLQIDSGDAQSVLDDYAEGVRRGVIGSPHFFTPEGSFFCPSLDVHRDATGELHVDVDPDGFDTFIASCFP